MRVVFANFGMPMPFAAAVIGCYPSDVGWLNIILFMIVLLLSQFSTFQALSATYIHPIHYLVIRYILSGLYPL